MQYDEYLRSPEWRALSERAKQIDGYRCRCCNSAERLQVHHRKYPKDFAFDCTDNLTTLCERCHEAISVAVGHLRCPDYEKISSQAEQDAKDRKWAAEEMERRREQSTRN